MTASRATLRRNAPHVGVANLEDFVGILRIDRAAHLRSAVAEAMTINETSFFRDRKMFDVLRKTILPRLIEAKSAERRLRIWSAGCSTGQEAYSVAMLISEYFANLAGWDVKIVGTDISREMVDYAKGGRYRRMEVNRGLPARMLVKYLERDGEEWKVAPKVKSICEFHCANLHDPLPKLPVFDLVMLRNVLLYFPQRDRTSAFDTVYRQMAPGGYLVLGSAEQAEDSTALFQAEFSEECYFYRPASRP